MRARISKWGNSLALRIPKALWEQLDLADGTQVQLAARDGSIIITPVSSKYALEDLVEGITTENCHTETDWGELRGAETW